MYDQRCDLVIQKFLTKYAEIRNTQLERLTGTFHYLDYLFFNMLHEVQRVNKKKENVTKNSNYSFFLTYNHLFVLISKLGN